MSTLSRDKNRITDEDETSYEKQSLTVLIQEKQLSLKRKAEENELETGSHHDAELSQE